MFLLFASPEAAKLLEKQWLRRRENINDDVNTLLAVSINAIAI